MGSRISQNCGEVSGAFLGRHGLGIRVGYNTQKTLLVALKVCTAEFVGVLFPHSEWSGFLYKGMISVTESWAEGAERCQALGMLE